MIKLIIFDMAGTAIDEDNVVYKTIQASIQKQVPDLTLDVVLEHGAGKEKKQAIADILEVVNGHPAEEELVQSIHANFKSSLDKAYDVQEMRVFPGVLKVMAALRKEGIGIVFNTGYTNPVAKKILHKVGIEEGKDIDLLVTADQVENGRPAPDMILLACQKMNIPPAQSIKIGDSQIDIEEGRNAGVKYSIGITTGAQNREMLLAAQPNFILDDAIELLGILKEAVSE